MKKEQVQEKILHPANGYLMLLLGFGNYYGTIKKEGFFWVNPFCSAINPTVKAVPVATGSVEGRITTAGVSAGGKKVSLRMMTDDDPGQQKAEGQRSVG